MPRERPPPLPRPLPPAMHLLASPPLVLSAPQDRRFTRLRGLRKQSLSRVYAIRFVERSKAFIFAEEEKIEEELLLFKLLFL